MSGQQAVLRIPADASELKEVSIQPSVIVAGDHPAGLLMAEHLADLGVAVTLMVPFPTLEEVVAPYRVIASADESVAGLLQGVVERVSQHAGITRVTQADLVDISGWWGDFSVQARVGEELKTFQTSGIALAYRGIPADLPGIPAQEGVLSFTDFLSGINFQTGVLAGKAEPPKQVVFLLDTGERDEKWASAAAIRVGLFLKRNFGTQVFILCRELKVSVDEMEQDYRAARESGIIVFKYRQTPKVEKGSGGLCVVFEDAAAVSSHGPSEITLDAVDVVVVQERLGLSEDRAEVLKKLRIPLEGGFAGPNNPQFTGRTPKKGVVVAGDAWFPEYPTDAAMTSLSAAQELYK